MKMILDGNITYLLLLQIYPEMCNTHCIYIYIHQL